MPALEPRVAPERPRAPERGARREGTVARDRFWPVLGWLLAAALVLRLWSIGHGLPFVFNPDEELHFVSRAVGMFGGSLNPDYFENPPALTYLLHVVFRIAFTEGFPFGAGGFRADFLDDPEAAYLVARVVVALLGTAAVALVAWAGARFYGRPVGLVAGALIAFAFLPAFYSKQALNDVVTLVPVTLALVACLAVLERGRTLDWALAGAACGLSCATKYTAGATVIVLLVAVLVRVRDRRTAPVDAVKLLALAGAAFTLVFLVVHPYSVLDFDRFRGAVGNQAGTAGRVAKLGQADVPGWLYYVWTLTWGLGVLPLAAALAGAVIALRSDARRAALVIAFPLLLFLFLGAQTRYFGRWYLAAYPGLAILAGLAAVRAADRLPLRGPRARGAALAAIAALLALQGLVSNVRVDAVLSREDTRALLRAWMQENVPRGAGVAIEPFTPAGFLTTGGRTAPRRYRLFPVERPYQEYEFRIRPELVDAYRSGGFCWVVTASYQRQRGVQAGLRNAREYYRRLESESRRAAVFSPYSVGSERVRFNFDLSFNYLPLAYARPGPEIEVHRLRSCA